VNFRSTSQKSESPAKTDYKLGSFCIFGVHQHVSRHSVLIKQNNARFIFAAGSEPK